MVLSRSMTLQAVSITTAHSLDVYNLDPTLDMDSLYWYVKLAILF